MFHRKYVLNHEDSIVALKAKKMEELMESIDPEGIQPDFWKKVEEIQEYNPFKIHVVNS